ncbi:MAG: amidase [Blastocatellia bacterium]|jgi:Asp-tRNA(Asn)/Glu-tRNA(Gln) amidotransferase A subunit family amidase|nr:amidase [Blastocatellia bacterium]
MAIADLTSYSATKLAQLIKTRAVSPVEVMQAHLQRIEQVNPPLNAIVTLAPDAMDRARVAEAKVISGNDLGPLHGVPITIKDTIETAGLRTTFGSRLRAEFVPENDAPVVARLKAAGAIVLGKTNTPELAIPYETENAVFGRTNNPHDLSRTAGGSSGGEAAAIAARLSPAGLGSDLSGSIRVPAHFCGIAGLKPTSQRVPMQGHVPQAIGPLAIGACIGPMARRVEDLRLLFNVMADPGYSPANKEAASVVTQVEDSAVRGLNIGWYADDGVVPVTPETSNAVRSVAAALSRFGACTSECLPPGVLEGSRLWIEMFSQSSLDQIREFARGREGEMGPSVRALMSSVSMSPAEAQARSASALDERNRLRDDLLQWMERYPIIIAPVGSTQAFTHGMQRLEVEGKSISVFRAFSYSQTYNVFDLPVVTVPVGRSNGLPIGVQIVGRPFAEDLVLTVAALVEREIAIPSS